MGDFLIGCSSATLRPEKSVPTEGSRDRGLRERKSSHEEKAERRPTLDIQVATCSLSASFPLDIDRLGRDLLCPQSMTPK